MATTAARGAQLRRRLKKLLEQLRLDVIRVGIEMLEKGLTIGTGGNISALPRRRALPHHAQRDALPHPQA